MQDYEPDDIDFEIVHALQIEPRVSWNSLAPILSVDPVTISRRYQRLRDAGLIWITGYTRRLPGSVSLIEIECEPGTSVSTAQALALDPMVATIDFTSGSRDLLLTLAAQDPFQASRFILDRLGDYPTIRRARSHLVTEMIFEAGSWRLKSLTAAQAAQIPRPRPPRSRAARTVSEDLKRAILHELATDGRTATATIAERADVSNQRVIDAIATMRQDGTLRLRTDIAKAYSEWPVNAWYFMQVPARMIERFRTSLSRMDEVRFAVLVASEYNLIISVWLRTLNDVHRFELHLEQLLSGARVADRSVIVQIGKHLGRILDAEGRTSGPVVPFYQGDESS